MRLLKKWDKINFNSQTEKIEPFRSFYLTQEEFDKISTLPIDEEGMVKSSIQSELLLKEILLARSMESLLYPERERDDWSGFVRVFPDGLMWML